MKQDNCTYCVILITVSSEEEGAIIANTLLTEELAACVNMAPIQSFYSWQGKIQHDQEWQLLIKTRFDLFEKLAKRVQVLHSYDIPEIIALPIVAGSQDYLNWITENTQPS